MVGTCLLEESEHLTSVIPTVTAGPWQHVREDYLTHTNITMLLSKLSIGVEPKALGSVG